MILRCSAATLVFGATTWLLVSTAGAADEFDRQDSNQDGVLSGREVTDLKLLDQDGDGEVSRKEFASAVDELRERASLEVTRLLKELDGNEDGRLSGTEMSGLDHFDKNNDRRITEAELRTGFITGDAALSGKPFIEIKEIAASRFKLLDITEDGRLTGTEISGSRHFDLNTDGRVVEEEFVIGLILSSTGAEAGPDESSMSEEGIDRILADIVKAMNDSTKSKLVLARFHDDIQAQVHPPLFEYALKHAHSSHGVISLPAKDTIKSSVQESGEIQIEAGLKCEQGQLTLLVRLLKGKITGFSLDSQEMDMMETAIFRDLQTDELQESFSAYYGDMVKALLSEVMKKETDAALQRIHPAVIEQHGREAFVRFLDQIRSKISELEALELESFSVEVSEREGTLSC